MTEGRQLVSVMNHMLKIFVHPVHCWRPKSIVVFVYKIPLHKPHPPFGCVTTIGMNSYSWILSWTWYESLSGTSSICLWRQHPSLTLLIDVTETPLGKVPGLFPCVILLLVIRHTAVISIDWNQLPYHFAYYPRLWKCSKSLRSVKYDVHSGCNAIEIE